MAQYCIQCGVDISLKRRGSEFCSDRCRKRRVRNVDPQIIADKEERATKRHLWPKFRVVAGPPLPDDTLHAVSVSDRDPETGRSSWEEFEERNRRLFP